MNKLIYSILSSLLLLTVTPSWANVQEDSAALLLERLNSLQQEIQQLRGEMEVQAHDLKLLHQQQQAFYQDIDRRMDNAQPATKSTTEQAIIEQTLTKPATATEPTNDQQARANTLPEQARYSAAYQQVRDREFDEAIAGMQDFLAEHPDSQFAVNAHYWLGELYLTKEQPDRAIEQFNIVLTQYPSSTKTAHAMLKLGYAYQAQGDLTQAREQLNQVQRDFPGSNTAKLAENRLQSIDHDSQIG